MSQVAFRFDASRCIGCQSCRVACQVHNESGPAVAWRHVTPVETGTFPHVARFQLSIACNHCARPACAAACPTGALYKRLSDGAVLLEASLCNGCERCVAACPYGAPQVVPGAGRVSKCDLCTTRRDAGERPVCVETCVGGALDFAPLEGLDTEPGLVRALPGFPDPSWTEPSIRFVPPR